MGFDRSVAQAAALLRVFALSSSSVNFLYLISLSHTIRQVGSVPFVSRWFLHAMDTQNIQPVLGQSTCFVKTHHVNFTTHIDPLGADAKYVAFLQSR